MKMPTHKALCSEKCGTLIERDLRLKGKRVTCAKCKAKNIKEYGRQRNAHISFLLKEYPFKMEKPS